MDIEFGAFTNNKTDKIMKNKYDYFSYESGIAFNGPDNNICDLSIQKSRFFKYLLHF